MQNNREELDKIVEDRLKNEFPKLSEEEKKLLAKRNKKNLIAIFISLAIITLVA